MTSRQRQLVWWGVASGYMALIFWLSSRAHNVSIHLFPYWDKVVHFIEYGILAILLFGALESTFCEWSQLRRATTAILMATLYALSDEFHQSFVPGREASGMDLMADFTGAFLCVAGIAWVKGGHLGALSSEKVIKT